MTAIADTGFLVAFLSTRDRHHAWAIELAAQTSGPVLTCEPVLTETSYHLRNVGIVMDLLTTGWLEVDFNVGANGRYLADLAARFADQQPDLSDLCLVRMSELFPKHSVLTTDREDFQVYRRNRREMIPTIFPPAN
jgi:predicted nucleic acid-binding protein